MGLSYDLISEFVKITNDKKENTKEGTVYATVVSGTGGKYVRIDGSDLLTPMDTTTDIEDGERVTLMIKDHKAIVTGNVTTPSASTSKVDKVTESVNSVSDRVGTFELVVADKVSTKELEAYKATIEVLIANKATIEDLTATNAKIENLEVKNAEIENLVAEKATIEDLEAVNATIENLKVKDAEIENAVVENLKATTADIKILNADFAQIKTLVNGNLTSDNILSFNLTSEKVTVDDAFIKDAMIDTISAGKINAGKINTNSVSIGSEDGGMLITGSTQQFTDKNGNVRIQIGKDASGDFTFVLYGEDGRGQLINQNGITASAISDGLIVNNMVSDHAAISGGKLDISSVITEINSDNSTTIQSSKIYLNDQAQSLEVAFNSLKTQVDTIQEVTIQGDLTAIVEQVQSNTSKIEANKNSINTLISEDTVIKKQVTDLQGTLNETETTLNSKYTTLSQNLDGFKTTVADTYATKKSVTDVVDNIESNYSTTSVMNSAIEQKAQEISASVSSTYATKNQVNTLDNNLKTNYSTTQQMESAINVAKEAIKLGVSSTYETKANVESKVTSTLKSAKSYADTKKSEAISTAATDATSKANTAKSEAIKSANNTLSSTIANYYTKSQTDSQINVAKEAINLGVSSTYETKENTTSKIQNAVNNIQVGGTNLLPGTKLLTAGIKSPSFISSDTYLGFKIMHCNHTDDDFKDTYSFSNLINVEPNTEYTLSFYAKGSGAIHTFLHPNAVSYGKNSNGSTTNSTDGNITTTVTNEWKRYWITWKTLSNMSGSKNLIISRISKGSDIYICGAKFEKGNKPTDWTPAPEDISADISTAKQEAITSANNTLTSTISNYYTKAQTDSQINIAKEAINLGVSSTYETKANVETKINNIAIGGTNLIANSNFAKNAYWSTNSTTAYNDNGYNGNRCITITRSGSTNSSRTGTTSTTNSINDVIPKGTIFTLSGWVYVHSGSGIPTLDEDNSSFFLRCFRVTDDAIVDVINIPIPRTTEVNKWVYFSKSGTIFENYKAHPSVSFYLGKNGKISLSQVKLEYGNKATSWTAAPEDIQSEISTIESETKTIKAAVTSLQLGTDSINASVKSLQETMTSTTNGLASDISKVQDQVKLAMTSADVKLEIQKEMSKGANKVSTSTGFTFDQNGLNISKTDSEMKTQITEDGMKIYKNSEVMLTANNQGVDAKNLHATTYLVIGNNSRMEDFTENGSKRTAVFWIG